MTLYHTENDLLSGKRPPFSNSLKDRDKIKRRNGEKIRKGENKNAAKDKTRIRKRGKRLRAREKETLPPATFLRRMERESSVQLTASGSLHLQLTKLQKA